MNENIDKHIESLVEKAMGKSDLQTPSFDFTSNLMSQVEKVNQNAVTTYKPLISKPVWAMILIAFFGVVSYIMLVSNSESSEWFANINYNVFDINQFTNMFNNLHPSRIVAYGVGLFSIMCLIQIPLLKNYFDRRIQF